MVLSIKAKDCVTVISHMGTDATVVNAARVSFDTQVDENKPIEERDAKLIKYLAVHHHDSPFFHPMVRLRIKMPIFVAREWFRHQVGFARNEVSRRYVTLPVECFLPELVREKHPQKKQGSKDTPVEEEKECQEIMKMSMESSIVAYRSLLEKGVAPEIARMVLPQSMFTTFIETASLAAYSRMYRLRNAEGAQQEIREYAEAIGEIMGNLFPVSWKCLTS